MTQYARRGTLIGLIRGYKGNSDARKNVSRANCCIKTFLLPWSCLKKNDTLVRAPERGFFPLGQFLFYSFKR